MQLGIEEKGNQTVRVTISLENHVSAPSAIPAVGPALWNIFFAPETATPIPSVTGRHMNHHGINKFPDFHGNVTLQ
jgi:hypothetical protein